MDQNSMLQVILWELKERNMNMDGIDSQIKMMLGLLDNASAYLEKISPKESLLNEMFFLKTLVMNII